MTKPGETGIKRIISASSYSYTGLKVTFKYEAAFRQELLLCVFLCPLAIYIADNALELALLLSSLFLILIVELINSAIEVVVDRFGGEIHELSGRAKDIGSAAVLLTLLNAALIWVLLLWP